MNDKRSNYSSSPLWGMDRRSYNGRDPYRGRGQNGGGNYYGRQKNQHLVLQFFLSLLLPILFVAALILSFREVHFAFLVLALACLLIMWSQRAFIKSARQTLTLIYITLMLVSLAAALWFSKPLLPQRTEQTPPSNPFSGTGLFGNDVTASQIDAFTESQQASPVVTNAPTPDGKSLAQAQLEYFMNSWMNLDYGSMLSFCLPSWVNAQADPQRSIFTIRGTSTPVNYHILYVSGSDSDDSRTISMEASIDKGNGKPPVLYRYEVLMIRVNSVWYVDPNSLTSYTEVVSNASPAPVYTLQPTTTPDPDLMLYYNPAGGSFYHKDPNCKRVSSNYTPLRGSFRYSQVNDDEYKKLSPCTQCKAPNRQ